MTEQLTERPLPVRRIGPLTVGAQGLGCLGLSEFYGPVEERAAVAVIHRALELGATLLDTADVYGHGGNEQLIGRALSGRRREAAVIATKFGVVRPGEGVGTGIRADPAYVRESCEASLRRLGVEHLDLFQLTRADRSVPIEETAGALAELIAEGKIRAYGLSEVSSATLRRAHAVAPVAALQSEWSLWSRDLERETVAVCRELGVAILPYAPLGRGFLAGAVRSVEQLDADDFRRIGLPRFEAANLARNLPLVDRLARLADELGVTAAQLALAWLHHQGPDVIPIPGTKQPAHLAENTSAAHLRLSPAQLDAVALAVPAAEVRGERWNTASTAYLDG
ncbi:aldo/keto reductase [Kitasatospora sp. NBC_01287]|uniref:aldo/keto reductase n=1 Tax=Kitasatospora sp. NBC_01287 TaxID=2903573 RepID=UPI00225ADE35|nr:aldo/keto reductase [Kitasatospora sp. NBC_01287]MCX4751612.1 aldo/keto reductase [Kitasatospora sp. NBC_01287]